jgi:hypothetical protein
MSGSSRSKSSPEKADGGAGADRAPRFVSNLAQMKIDRSEATGRRFDLSAKPQAKRSAE